MKLSKKRFSLFGTLNSLGMFIILFVCIFPFWYSVVGSFNEGMDYSRGGVIFWPRTFTLANYKAVFANSSVYSAYRVTVLRTVIGTLVHVLFTSLVAYGISRKNLIGKNVYAFIFIFTMYFSGGMIPVYLLYKGLHLLDSFWVYIIPTIYSCWDMIIFQSFFKELPDSIMESARIDGAGEYRIWFQIIIPLSKPVLAAITLFTAVWHWNSFYDSLIYTTSMDLQTIQLYLWKIITQMTETSRMGSQAAKDMPGASIQLSSDTLQLATMVVAVVPILVVYPFLQKYFVKGIMIGSIKG